jgi:hypothetical protein
MTKGTADLKSATAFAIVAYNSKKLVQPHLVAIYSDRRLANGTTKPDQIGTGFLVSWRDYPTLVTAKHTLYGANGSEDPRRKKVFVNGELLAIQRRDNTKAAMHPIIAALKTVREPRGAPTTPSNPATIVT